MMKEFNTLEELQADKELQKMCRYEFRKVKLDGREVFACSTNQQYEDIIWGGAYNIIDEINKKYGTSVDEDLASDIRDYILDKLETKYGVEFVDVYDEY